MNRENFFAKIKELRLLSGFTQKQVDSINAILDETERQKVTDTRQIAYIFATAYWEAHNPNKPDERLTPMKEFGGEAYLRSKSYYPYFGRGFSQLTWLDNYRKEGARLGIDLTNSPDLILILKYAANSHVYCMKNGTYTGKKLSDYINEKKCDFVRARKIINGTDKATEIAAIANKFLQALS